MVLLSFDYCVIIGIFPLPIFASATIRLHQVNISAVFVLYRSFSYLNYLWGLFLGLFRGFTLIIDSFLIFLKLHFQYMNLKRSLYKISHQAIQFNYYELLDVSSNLHDRIEQAFGPKGFGLCIVSDIPHYLTLRKKLLPLAYQLATLEKETLKRYERPDIFYSKGWSRGVEQGQFDNSKGSLYNNPLYDVPYCQEGSAGQKLEEPNVWPEDTVPQLEGAFKSLGRLMVDVGAMLAHHIDKYIWRQQANYEMGKLFRFIKQGDAHTGRLLHYYATGEESDWCGWHNDHSALTALTSPIYLTSAGEPAQIEQNNGAGLFAKNRFNEVTRINMKSDCLAFQIGETTQIVSGGIVEATPHCVVQSSDAKKLGLNRNTFAVFMAPRNNEILNVPKGMDPNQALNKPAYQVPSLVGRFKPNISYSEYSYNSFKAYS